MNLKKNVASLGLALTLLAFAPTSSSAFTVTLDGNTATGVQDLFVPGLDTYNITFRRTTAAQLYGGPSSPVFQLTDGEATFAMGFLNDALDSLGLPGDPITDTVGPSFADSANTYFVGVDVTGDGSISIQTRNSVNALDDFWDTQAQESVQYDEVRIYADFQPVVVPEPSTAILMGLGLVGLASRRGRP
jgi:hypothetical protein